MEESENDFNFVNKHLTIKTLMEWNKTCCFAGVIMQRDAKSLINATGVNETTTYPFYG